MVVVSICIKTSKLAAVLWPGFFLPAAAETLRLQGSSGRSVPAGAAHGAAAPLLAPRVPSNRPLPLRASAIEPLSQPLTAPSPSKGSPHPPRGVSAAAAARSEEAIL
ncbi:unnamed protein product [Pleuronectes platessa]|uniref:Uncharacterized protein n=1 Tax=Pleuronectes platessa TaxID=8262 RepID=A0A9N7UA58_PLEPL|nr:unnamed protein product [Pleuronectes platessa]